MAPLRVCLRRRLRMRFYTLSVFFASFRHLKHTPPGQGRVGATFNRCAKRLHHEGPSRARLGLDRWVDSPLPDLGFDAPFSLSLWLADLATLAVRPTPPQASLAVAWFH